MDDLEIFLRDNILQQTVHLQNGRSMIRSIPMMEIHEKFTEWATEKGVKINGIRPHRFDERGLGIIAERDFKVRRTFFTLFLHVSFNILRSCTKLAVRNLHHEFPVSSILLPLHFALVRSEFSQKGHFHPNNMIILVKISALFFLIRSTSGSSLFQLICFVNSSQSLSIFLHLHICTHP